MVDFLNLGMEEKCPIEWNTDGCTVSVWVGIHDTEYKIVVEDNGTGVTDEKLEKMQDHKAVIFWSFSRKDYQKN